MIWDRFLTKKSGGLHFWPSSTRSWYYGSGWQREFNKKAVLSQRWPRDAPYSLYGCSEKFWESLATPTANFPDILMDFCSGRSRDCVQNLKSEGVGPIVRAINFQDLQPMWSWSTNVTDGRTNAHIQGGPKKTAHGVHCNNFVYSQPIFIIFGRYKA